MDEYKEPYLRLWRGVTDAMDAIENRNCGSAADLLRAAQAGAEEAYVSESDAAENIYTGR